MCAHYPVSSSYTFIAVKHRLRWWWYYSFCTAFDVAVRKSISVSAWIWIRLISVVLHELYLSSLDPSIKSSVEPVRALGEYLKSTRVQLRSIRLYTHRLIHCTVWKLHMPFLRTFGVLSVVLWKCDVTGKKRQHLDWDVMDISLRHIQRHLYRKW
jgi:hypothetical protein